AGYLRDDDGNVNLFTVVGLTIAGIAPIAAVVLSLIHSPGADTHAAHKGEPQAEGGMGLFGTLSASLALLGTVIGFALTVHSSFINGTPDATLDLFGQELPFGAIFRLSVSTLGVSLLTAALALVLGPIGVVGNERIGQRP